MTGQQRRSHHDRQAVECEFQPPKRNDMAWEISIHLYMLFKIYIENKDSDYPQNR